MDTSLFGMIAGGFSFFGFVLYVLSIIKGTTRPNRATWIILTVVGVILAGSYYVLGARDTMWMPLSYVIGPFIVMVLSVKYGEGGWSKLDQISFLGAGLSLLIWWISGSALIVLMMNICIDFFGILPTIVKSYQRPDGENVLAWSLDVVASAFNLFAINNWNFEIAAYPVYMLVIHIIIVSSLLVSSLMKRNFSLNILL